MGVVQRQGAKYIVVSVFSMMLGVFNNIFIYARYPELHGIAQSTLNLAFVLLPLAVLGVPSVIMRFQNHFRTANGRYSGLLRLAFTWFSVSFIVFGIVYFLFIKSVYGSLEKIFPNIDLVLDSRNSIYVLIGLTGCNSMLIYYSNLHRRIVVPQILQKLVGEKILLPMLVVGVAYFGYAQPELIGGLIAIKVLILFSLLIYMSRNGWLNIGPSERKISAKLKRQMFRFSSFSLFNSLGAQLAFRVDVIMVGILLDAKSAGFYAIFLFLARTIDIPLQGVARILYPMIGDDWSRNDLDAIKEKYRRTGLGMTAATIFIFLCIDLSIHDILIVIKQPDLISARFVFLFAAAGGVVSGMNALNGIIINQSNKYDRNLVFTLILGVTNIVLTYVFVRYLFEDPLKPAGAACATAVSIILYNFMKTAYIYKAFKMHPFSIRHIWIVLIGSFAYGVMYLLPNASSPWLDIVLNGIGISILFAVPVYTLKLSGDVNQVVDKYVILLLRELRVKRFLHWRT